VPTRRQGWTASGGPWRDRHRSAVSGQEEAGCGCQGCRSRMESWHHGQQTETAPARAARGSPAIASRPGSPPWHRRRRWRWTPSQGAPGAGESVIGFGAGEPDFRRRTRSWRREAACRDPRTTTTPDGGCPSCARPWPPRPSVTRGWRWRLQVLITTAASRRGNAFAVLCDPATRSGAAPTGRRTRGHRPRRGRAVSSRRGVLRVPRDRRPARGARTRHQGPALRVAVNPTGASTREEMSHRRWPPARHLV